MPRPWIKVQLSAHQQAEEAANIVQVWKGHRQAARHIIRAVHLYSDLLQGDLATFEEYFPGVAINFRSTSLRRSKLVAPTITFSPKSETEELDEALNGLGLESLDFGNGN